ncbi:Rz1-like lysis system protein LysC [Pantoea sp. KPR_PJ]|uniref:Rz1-like lysis system protein LysC n=1 Tax=Pantoea sp. KPR_PJ TaxID=2738375 RepID=UPI0035285AD8
MKAGGCLSIICCQQNLAAPRSNGDLSTRLDETQAAWVACADKVDTFIRCQEKMMRKPQSM